MPPFKSSLSEEERWQALTYIWSLGAAVPAEVPPPPGESFAEGENGTLQLTVPGQGQPGQRLTLTATLRDKEGKPIGSATVKFLIKVDFFTSGLMEIGDALTNDRGVAVLEYTLRQTGDIEVMARYQAIEAATTVSLGESAEPFYQAEAGLPDSTRLPEVFIGPKSALVLGPGAVAPTTALRIPGGLPSLLLLAYVFAVILVWGLYLHVMYQLLRISIVGEVGGTNTRLLPLAAMTVMVALVILLVAILITGPYSHFHLPP